MPWFKVDDGFHGHPKVMDLSLEAVGLWTLAGTWCANYLTDGEIPMKVIKRLGGAKKHAKELVVSGLWTEKAPEIYQFCGWNEYQPTKNDVEAEREAARERMREHRAKRKGTAKTEPAEPSGKSEDVRPNTPVTEGERSDEPPPHVQGTLDERSDEVREPRPSPPPLSPVPSPNKKLPSSATPKRFDEFWEWYPRKVSKADARKAYAKAAAKFGEQVIVDGAERLRLDPNLPADKNLIPHPTTWLNGERWDDEPYSPPVGQVRPTGSQLRLAGGFDLLEQTRHEQAQAQLEIGA